MGLSTFKKTYGKVVVVCRGEAKSTFRDAQVSWKDDPKRVVIKEEDAESDFPLDAVMQVLKEE